MVLRDFIVFEMQQFFHFTELTGQVFVFFTKLCLTLRSPVQGMFACSPIIYLILMA